jgi:hypothetical protein
MSELETTPFGFRWGSVTVERIASVERRPGEGKSHIVHVNDVHIYISPTGRSVRVFRRGVELKPERAS